MIKIKKIRSAKKIKDDFSKGDRAIVYEKLLRETITRVQRIQKDFNYDKLNNRILKRSKMVEFKLIDRPTLTVENTYGPYNKKLINKENVQPKVEVDEYEAEGARINSTEPEYDENFVSDAIPVVGNPGELQGGWFTYALRSRFTSRIEDKTFVNKENEDINNYADVLEKEILNWFNKKYVHEVTETKDNEELKYELTFNFSNPSVKSEIDNNNAINVYLDFDYFLKERTGSEYEGKKAAEKRVNQWVNKERKALEKTNEEREKQGLAKEEIPSFLQERKKSQLNIADDIINKFDEFSKYNISSTQKYFPNFRKSYEEFKRTLKKYLEEPTKEGLENSSNAYASLLNTINSDFDKQGYYEKEFFGLQKLNIDEAVKQFKDAYGLDVLFDKNGKLTYKKSDLE